MSGLRSKILLFVCVVLWLSLSLNAQESASPDPTTQTPVETLTPTPTEFSPTLTDIPTLIPSDLPTKSATASETPALETPTSTETQSESFPTYTPNLPTATLPAEPALTPIFLDTFDTTETSRLNWVFGAGWGYNPLAEGQALRVYNNNAFVIWQGGSLQDAAVDAQVIVNYGSAAVSLRQSEAGAYAMSLDTMGQVTLTRAGAVVGQAQVPASIPDQWRVLRLSAVGGVIRASVDGLPVLTYEDAAPLPAGQVTFHAEFAPLPADYGTPYPPVNTVQFDNVTISSLAQNGVPTPTSTGTATPTLTSSPTASLTNEPVVGSGFGSFQTDNSDAPAPMMRSMAMMTASTAYEVPLQQPIQYIVDFSDYQEPEENRLWHLSGTPPSTISLTDWSNVSIFEKIQGPHVDLFMGQTPLEAEQRLSVTLPRNETLLASDGVLGAYNSVDDTSLIYAFRLTLFAEFYDETNGLIRRTASCIKPVGEQFYSCPEFHSDLVNISGVRRIDFVVQMDQRAPTTTPGAEKHLLMDSFNFVTDREEASCARANYAFTVNTFPGSNQSIANASGLTVYNDPSQDANSLDRILWGMPEAIEIDRWYDPNPNELWYRVTGYTNPNGIRFLQKDVDGEGEQPSVWGIQTSDAFITWQAPQNPDESGQWITWNEMTAQWDTLTSGVNDFYPYQSFLSDINDTSVTGKAAHDLWVNARWGGYSYLEGVTYNNPCQDAVPEYGASNGTTYYQFAATERLYFVEADGGGDDGILVSNGTSTGILIPVPTTIADVVGQTTLEAVGRIAIGAPSWNGIRTLAFECAVTNSPMDICLADIQADGTVTNLRRYIATDTVYEHLGGLNDGGWNLIWLQTDTADVRDASETKLFTAVTYSTTPYTEASLSPRLVSAELENKITDVMWGEGSWAYVTVESANVADSGLYRYNTSGQFSSLDLWQPLGELVDVSTENILAVELGLNDYDPDQGVLYEVQINYTRPDQTQGTYYKIGRIGSSVSDRVMQRTGTAATGAMSRYKAVFGRDGGVFVRDLEQNRSFTAYTYTNLWQAILVQLGLASGRNANTAMMSMALTENTGPNAFELGFDQGDFQQNGTDPTPTPTEMPMIRDVQTEDDLRNELTYYLNNSCGTSIIFRLQNDIPVTTAISGTANAFPKIICGDITIDGQNSNGINFGIYRFAPNDENPNHFFRYFEVCADAMECPGTSGQPKLTLSNLYITGGYIKNTASESAHLGGGAILSLYGIVTLDSVSLHANRFESSTAAPIYGGALYAELSNITISKSIIDENSIESDSGSSLGGGIALKSAYLSMANSTIQANFASSNTGSSWGGGLYASQSTITIDKSEINTNSVTSLHGTGYGGGFADDGMNVNITMSYSSISGNQGGVGGAIYFKDVESTSRLDINYSCLTNNKQSTPQSDAMPYFDVHLDAGQLDQIHIRNTWWNGLFGQEGSETVNEHNSEMSQTSLNVSPTDCHEVNAYPTTPTPIPTLTSTPTMTPTSLPTLEPTPDVMLEAVELHKRADQFGLPSPFAVYPIDQNPSDTWSHGYGATGYAALNEMRLYSRTQGIHTGIDYGPNGGEKRVLAVCDGVVIYPGRAGSSGSAAGEKDEGITLACFASGNTDLDGDGNIDLSNVVVTYNHLWKQIVVPTTQFSTVVRAGDPLGTVIDVRPTPIPDPNVTPTPDPNAYKNHLHFEVFIRGIEDAAPVTYGFRDGLGSIRINPLYMFNSTLAGIQVAKFDVQNPVSPSHPYYPYYNPSTTEGQPITNLELTGAFNEGIPPGTNGPKTIQGDYSIEGLTFWDVQDPEVFGIEWPIKDIIPDIQEQELSPTLYSSDTNTVEPLSLIDYLRRFYPDGTSYFDPSTGESRNCNIPVLSGQVAEIKSGEKVQCF